MSKESLNELMQHTNSTNYSEVNNNGSCTRALIYFLTLKSFIWEINGANNLCISRIGLFLITKLRYDLLEKCVLCTVHMVMTTLYRNSFLRKPVRPLL